MQTAFMILSLLTAIFLILLVLVQRGRGGGLTGALGGMGGQSAFGSKAGDLFTRITIGVAAFWIILSVASIKFLDAPAKVFGDTDKTSFEVSDEPSLSTDDPEGLPPEVDPLSTIGNSPTGGLTDPSSDTSTSDSSTEPATPAATEEAAASSETPAEPAPEPAASESTEPAATEATEAEEGAEKSE